MSILTNLTPLWKLDEPSGNALDAIGSLDLTAVNAPGTAAGPYGMARTFNGTNQSFSAADSAAIPKDNITWSMGGWFYLTNKSTTQYMVAADQIGARNWGLHYNQGADRFSLEYFEVGGSGTAVNATTFGSPAAATWYHICWGFDEVNNEFWIAINGGAQDVASFGGAPANHAATFRIGQRGYSGFEQPMGGRVKDVAVWLNKELSTNERILLYNGGNGIEIDSYMVAGDTGFTRMPSGTVDQTIYFEARGASDQSVLVSGLTSFTVYRSRNGGAATKYTTPTITEIDPTFMPGVYALLLDEDTTINVGDFSQEQMIRISAPGMRSVTRVVELYDPNWDILLDGTNSASKVLRAVAAAIAGNASKTGNTFAFRDMIDSQDMVVGDADGSGNRTSVVYGT